MATAGPVGALAAQVEQPMSPPWGLAPPAGACGLVSEYAFATVFFRCFLGVPEDGSRGAGPRHLQPEGWSSCLMLQQTPSFSPCPFRSSPCRSPFKAGVSRCCRRLLPL